MIDRIILGTAQFGSKYGISNTKGKVKSNDINDILNYAKNENINLIDTAIEYGNCEEELSKFDMNSWNIITKIPSIPDHITDISAYIESQVQKSQNKLNIKNFYSVLLHSPMQLLGEKGQFIWASLQNLKVKYSIEKIGFSIYSPDELDSLLGKYKPDIIQAPYNILDNRMESSGWLDRLQKLDIEVHARSVFLQGLLLMDPIKRPRKFLKWDKIWKNWDAWLKKNNLSPIEGCLAHALQNKKFKKIIIGVESVYQLRQIIKSCNYSNLSFPDFNIDDKTLIDPSKWNNL